MPRFRPPTKVGPEHYAPGKNHTFRIHVKAFPQNLNGTYFIIGEITGTAVNSSVASSTTTIAVEQGGS